MKKVFLFCIAMSLVFISCKKSSNNATCTLSSSSIVGNYKMTSYIATINGQTFDLFSDTTYTPLCVRDNIYSINSNGTFSESEGAISCNPPSTDGNNATWSLSGNNLTVVDSTTTQVFAVSDYSCASFKLNVSDSTSSMSFTFTKQ